MEQSRLIIYPKDIQVITGRSERYGRELISRIKEHFNKDDHHLVSVTEFCQFTGLNPDEVRPFLRA